MLAFNPAVPLLQGRVDVLLRDLTVTAGVNSSGKAVSGTLVLGLDADPEKKVEIALSQAAVDEEEGGE